MRVYLLVGLLIVSNVSWSFEEHELISFEEFVQFVLYGDKRTLTREQAIVQHQIINELLRNNQIHKLFPISIRELRTNHQSKIIQLQNKLLQITKNRARTRVNFVDHFIISQIADELRDLVPSSVQDSALASIESIYSEKTFESLRQNKFKLSQSLHSLSPNIRMHVNDNFPFTSLADDELLQIFSNNSDIIDSFFFAKLMNQLKPENKRELAKAAREKMFFVDYDEVSTWLMEFIKTNDVHENRVQNLRNFEEFFTMLDEAELTTSSITAEGLWRMFLNYHSSPLSEVNVNDLELLRKEFVKHFSSFNAETIHTSRLKELFTSFLADSLQRSGDFKSVPFSLHYFFKGHQSAKDFISFDKLAKIVSVREKFSSLDLRVLFQSLISHNDNLDHLSDLTILKILESLAESEKGMNPLEFVRLKRIIDNKRSVFVQRLEDLLDSSIYKENMKKLFKGNLGPLTSSLMPEESIRSLLIQLKDANLSLQEVKKALGVDLESNIFKLGSMNQSILKDELLKIFGPSELINFYEFLKAKMLTSNLETFRGLSLAVQTIELEISRHLDYLNPDLKIRFLTMYDFPENSLNNANLIIGNQQGQTFVEVNEQKFNAFDLEITQNIMREEKVIPEKVLRANIDNKDWDKIFQLAVEVINNQAQLNEIDQLENSSRFKRLLSTRIEPQQILYLLSSLKGNNLTNALTGLRYSEKGLIRFLEIYEEIKSSHYGSSVDLSNKYPEDFIEFIKLNIDKIERNMETLVELISQNKLKIMTLSGKITDTNRSEVKVSHERLQQIFRDNGVYLKFNQQENSLKYSSRNINLYFELIRKCLEPVRSN